MLVSFGSKSFFSLTFDATLARETLISGIAMSIAIGIALSIAMVLLWYCNGMF